MSAAQLSLLDAGGAVLPMFIAPHNPPQACRPEPIEHVRARRSDPSTSHQAADGAAAFAGSHCSRILRALASGPATAHELADLTGLTVVQIDRRVPELEREGKARVVVVDGQPVIRGGARVWERVAA